VSDGGRGRDVQVDMVVTLAVFHEPMLTLKAIAPRNVPDMSTTLATFHSLMSPLKVALL
jgi:hypothetical protein